MAQRSQAEEYAVFSVGSRLLSLDTDDSILSPILRGVLDLGVGADLLGFEGLADATVTLADLLDVSELNVGSVEQLLSADLTLLQLVDAVAGAVGEEEVVGLSALANLVALHLPNVELVLGDILGVTTDTIPLMAEINVPELLSTALLVASQGNAVALPGLNLSVPGVANIEAMLEVIEPPQIAIGPVGCIDDADPPCAGNWKTEARTAQLTLGLGANVNIPVLANLGVKLGVTAAGARAGIEDVDPADGGEWHKWDVEVSAEQYPLVSKLDLNLGVLSTSLPLLDPGLDGSGIPLLDEFLGSLGLAGSLLVNLLSAVGNLLGAVVGTLVTILEGILGLLASTNEYYKASTDEVCVEATALLGIIKRTRCEPAPKLTDDIGTGDQTIGWEPSLQDWISSFEAHASSSSMTPSSQRLEWPGQREASFTGSTEVALELGSLLSGIDLELQLFGANIPADGLLSPVLAVVQAVADEIVGSLAAGVIDPLLDELGVNISEAEVRVIHIDHRTGPPELL